MDEEIEGNAAKKAKQNSNAKSSAVPSNNLKQKHEKPVDKEKPVDEEKPNIDREAGSNLKQKHEEPVDEEKPKIDRETGSTASNDKDMNSLVINRDKILNASRRSLSGCARWSKMKSVPVLVNWMAKPIATMQNVHAVKVVSPKK